VIWRIGRFNYVVFQEVFYLFIDFVLVDRGKRVLLGTYRSLVDCGYLLSSDVGVAQRLVRQAEQVAVFPDNPIHMVSFFFIEMVQAQQVFYSVASHITIDRDRVNLACPETLGGVLRVFRLGAISSIAFSSTSGAAIVLSTSCVFVILM